MKNTIILSIMLLSTVFATAQARFDLRGGLNFASIHEKKSENSSPDGSKEKMIIGFTAGGRVHIPAGRINILTGIDIRQKGEKYETKDAASRNHEQLTFKAIYLDIPAQIQLFFKRGNTGLYALAGTYMGFGISGKTKYKFSAQGQPDPIEKSTKVEWGNGDTEVKRFDAGLSAGIGYQTKKGLFIQAEYIPGLVNINNDAESKVQHRQIAVTAGWRFGSGRKK